MTVNRFINKAREIKNAIVAKGRSICAAAVVVAMPVIAAAQEADPSEALITRATGASTTASTTYVAFAGLAVTAFILGTVIGFARKGRSAR